MKLQDYPYQPDHTDEQMAVVKDFLENGKDSFASYANFIVVTDNNTYHYTRMGCHASMQSGVAGKRKLIGTECGWGRRANTGWKSPNIGEASVFRPYFDWYFNRSYASNFILNKDDPEWAFNNGFIFSANMPSPLLQNCLISARHFAELSVTHFEMFNSLEPVIGGDLAYLIAFNSSINESGLVLSSTIHRPFGLPSDMAALTNYVNHDFGQELEQQAKQGDTYAIRATIYGGLRYFNNKVKSSPYSTSINGDFISDLCKNNDEFKSLLSDFRKANGTTKAVPNPFAQSKTYEEAMRKYNPFILNKEECMKILVPFLAKMFNSETPAEEVNTEVKELMYG